MIQPRRGVRCGGASGPEWADEDLRNDCADFTTCSGESVGCGSISCRKTLARNQEGGGVGTKFEEELTEDV